MPANSLKNTALNRISKIVDQVFKESEIFNEEVDKTEFMQVYSDLIDNGSSPKELISIADEELTRRVRQLMATELLGTLLDGLTPEDIRIFNEAVEGR
ncbi:hypothetical protein IH992_14435 [Candidatus Poribacteria bacterium]|nr:hypothetical protein [Candidatus Poribacteria bacterium]